MAQADPAPYEAVRVAELLAAAIVAHRDWRRPTHRTVFTEGNDEWFISFATELTSSGPFSGTTVRRLVEDGTLVSEPGEPERYRLSSLAPDSIAPREGSQRSEGDDPAAIVADYLSHTEPGARALNLGCGGATIAGWLNIDSYLPWHVDIMWDLNQGLPPIPSGSLDAVYSEAFWEHVTRPVAMLLLRDSLAALRSGGRVRISNPDLDEMLAAYQAGGTMPPDEKGEFTEQFGALLHTRGEWLNIAFRAWGHSYIYTFEDLELTLKEAGFVDIKREPHGISSVPMLANRETRPLWECSLIVEATKP